MSSYINTHSVSREKIDTQKKKKGRGSLKASPRGKHSHVWQEFWLHFQTSSITLESSEYTTRALQGFQEFTAADAVWKFLTDRSIQTCRICAWRGCWRSSRTPLCIGSGPWQETEEGSGSANQKNKKFTNLTQDQRVHKERGLTCSVKKRKLK